MFSDAELVRFKLREEGGELTYCELAVGLRMIPSRVDAALNYLIKEGSVKHYEDNGLPLYKLIKKRK